VEQAFASACHEVTGGVPFLVQELVRAIAEEAIEPTAAACFRLRALAPRAVSHSVVLRLRRLSMAANELARAAAVLGEADLRLAAGLARLDQGAAAGAADELAAAGILEQGRPLRFVHRSCARPSKQICPRASGPTCTRRQPAAWRTSAQLRTGLRPTYWRPSRWDASSRSKAGTARR
jgi:predicted ATPase